MTDEAHYLALDPGGSTGWATFDQKGDLVSMGTCNNRQQIYDLLKKIKPAVIIMEDWVSREKTPFGGDRMETIRVIGAIEFYCHIRQIPLHEQPNTIKPIGYMWAGISKAKSKRDSHERDAYVHGVYHLQKAGIRRPQQSQEQPQEQ